MDSISLIALFLFGTIIGSFLNVVICRMHTGKSLGGRSICTSCNQTLRWYELIPLASFFYQKGKCRTCGSRISWQYPLVELITALLFVGVAYRLFHFDFILRDFVTALVYIVFIFTLLLVIAWYDIRHQIIPDELSATVAIAGFSGSVFLYGMPVGDTLLAAVYCATPFLVLYLVSRGRWMGFGDVKLAAALGLFLGISHGIAAILLSFWIGALISLILVALFPKKTSFASAIPFGPFMVLATYAVVLLDIPITKILSLFS